uniref:LNP1 n=1 Tax=Macrostomum lignano TaxID=282301 RepID=A0A1I8I6L5_9PLAT
VLCWLCKRKAQRRKRILAAGGDREGIVGASGLKANGSTTAAAAPGPLAAMYQANNPANRDSDSVVGNSRERLVAKKEIHGLYQSAPSTTDSLRSGDNVDEDGNPIIIVNSGQQQDEMLEDAWLAAATNREPSDAAAASPVDASAAVRHGDSPAMQ